MAVVDVFQNQREFRCDHCSGKILVPKDLPPMTGPCPHCNGTITSPGPESEAAPSQRVSAKIEVPAVIVHEPASSESRKGSGPPPLPPMRPNGLPVVRSAEPGASPFRDSSAVAVAEPLPPLVEDLTAARLAEAERALAAERARSEAMEAAVAAEKALAEERASLIAAEKSRIEAEAVAAAEAMILADKRAIQVAAEKAIAEEKILAAEKALAEERALGHQRALATAAEKALAEDRAIAAEQAIARQRAAAEEQSRAIERALTEERARAAAQSLVREESLASERAAAEEKARVMAQALAEERALAQQRAAAQEQALARAAERALAEEQARAAERALAKQKALETEQALVREQALAAEKALAEQKAREMEQALAREKALAEERAAAAEKALALAAEKALEAERALAAERTLAAEKAFAEEKALAAERALAQEKAYAEEKALAAERAQAQEKAFAQEKAIAEEKARAAEEALAMASDKAKAAERALAQERALAREKSLAAERALAEERAMALAAEKALAVEKAQALQRAADKEKEIARNKAYYQPDVAPGYEPTFQTSPTADLPPRPPVARVDLPIHPPARPVETRMEPKPQPEAVTVPSDAPAPLPASVGIAPPDVDPLVKLGRVKKNKPKPHPWTIKPPKPASRKAVVIPMLVLLFLILTAGSTWIFFLNTQGRGSVVARPTMNSEAQALQREKYYLLTGWQDDARQVLADFLAAETAAGKSALSINGSELLTRMDEFYGAGKIDDTDTPISGFSAEQLPPDDLKRGIFTMRYDQPPQFEMRDFFRPIAPLEVQYGLQEPDLLLSSMAKVGNFTSEPVKVQVFFKRTPDGLRVDWETFIQSKYRTFRGFTELPNPGRKAIFRLFVVEDVPEQGKTVRGMKTYRMADPAHKNDSVRIEVPIDSELGRALSILNWRGVKSARPKTKTATLELEWTRDPSPRLSISRFICWEFLGIGGQAVTPTSGK